jgi:hypothetical protein
MPGPRARRVGNRWAEGEASIRSVLGRIRSFRHYCQPEAAAAVLAAAGSPEASEPAVQGGEGPQQKRGCTRIEPVEAGPAPFALQPYVCRHITRAGRSSWCLRCFEAPNGDYHTWRHGRCSGARPADTVPPSLRSTPAPELKDPMRSRWAEIVRTASPFFLPS